MLLHSNFNEYSFSDLKEFLAEYQYVFRVSLKSLCFWYPGIKHTYAKIPFGKHIWYDSQIVNMAVNRQLALAEKQPFAKISNPYLKGFIDGLVHLKNPYVRIYYMYRVLKPHYLNKFEQHLVSTDIDLDYGTYSFLDFSINYLREEIKESLPILEVLEDEYDLNKDSELITRLNQLWIAYQKSQLDDNYNNNSLLMMSVELTAKEHQRRLDKPERDVPVVQPQKNEVLDNTQIDLSNQDFKIAYLYANGYLELQASEIIASMIFEYFDTEWKIITDLSRQLYDECRHAQLCFRRMEELGGYLGQYTTSLLQWNYVHLGSNLVEKFIIQHRISEGTGTDASFNNVTRFREMGDEKTAKLYEFIGADEILHVKMGNKWIEHFLPDPIKRDEVINKTKNRIISYLEQEGYHIDFLSCVPVALEHRELAGFKAEEIKDIVLERNERCS